MDCAAQSLDMQRGGFRSHDADRALVVQPLFVCGWASQLVLGRVQCFLILFLAQED